MAEFTKAIGGDKVEVSTIIPDGVEPHDFELKPENMKQLATAQVFVYNGFGMEPWAKQAIEAAKNDKLVSVGNITSENLDARLEPTRVPIELEQLVISFNHMIGKD